jgi:hypothetical protein
VVDVNGDSLLELLIHDFMAKDLSIYCGSLPIISLPNAHVNTPYSQVIPFALIGTFALVSGSLPSGLTLSSTGVLAGTPTTSGSYTFTVSIETTQPMSIVTNYLNVTVTVTDPSAVWEVWPCH